MPLLVGLAGCPGGADDDTGDDDADDDSSEAGDDDSSEAGDDDADDDTGQTDDDLPEVEVVPGSAAKICQLSGDEDRQLGTATPNLTSTRFGLWGTDLGSSFEHHGRLWFLFGDSIPTDAGQGNPDCGDALAFSYDSDPSDCIELEFVTSGGGTYLSPSVPGVDLGCFDVPLDGVSVGQAMYVWFSTDTMTRSVLARSDDDGVSFSLVHDLSDDHFVNVSAELTPDDEGFPAETSGERLVLFGSGEYRASSVYLAATTPGQIEDHSALRFFAGTDPGDGAPSWSADEANAVPLFEHPCVGELSVHFNDLLDRWVLLYNCDDPRGIDVRTAPAPWGPWSEAAVAFQPWDDGGYCEFIHTSWDYDVCDEVHDPGREYEWGGEYGAYAIPSLTSGEYGNATIPFVLSTWNPYAVMLMQVQLRHVDRP